MMSPCPPLPLKVVVMSPAPVGARPCSVQRERVRCSMVRYIIDLQLLYSCYSLSHLIFELFSCFSRPCWSLYCVGDLHLPYVYIGLVPWKPWCVSFTIVALTLLFNIIIVVVMHYYLIFILCILVYWFYYRSIVANNDTIELWDIIATSYSTYIIRTALHIYLSVQLT